MAAILIYYFLISLTCLWSGFFFHSIFIDSKRKHGEGLKKHWIIYAFWGLVVLTLFGQVLELVMPVNQYTWVAFVLMLSLVSILNKHLLRDFCFWLMDIKKQAFSTLLMYGALTGFICVLGAGPILMDDTESYHIQMIKWIQEYGSVLGLANLHSRFGFNSSWFTFASLFIPKQTHLNFFTLANGVLSVWLSIYLFSEFWKSRKSNQNEPRAILPLACFLIFLVAILCWPMLRGNATNANYDFITTCMIVVLFVELLKQKGVNKLWYHFLPELFVWPVFLFTVRIINFPISLMSLFAVIVLFNQKKYRLTITCLAITIALIIPFLLRNVMLSGYIFYPIYQVDFFEVDWKVNPDIVKNLLSYIKYFNRINAGSKPIVETQKLNFLQWVPAWFYYLFDYDKPFFILSLAGYLLAIIRRKLLSPFSLATNFLLCSLVIQLISWFLIAPDPRFIYGPLLVGIFLIPFLVPKHFLPVSAYKKLTLPLSIILFGTLSVYALRKMVKDERYVNPLLPVTLPTVPTQLIKIDHIKYRIPEKILGKWNARCYATELPCLYEIQPGLSARGKTIGDGFKVNK